MELIIVIVAVGAAGAGLVIAAIAWQMHVKPRLRRRYERRHFRKKMVKHKAREAGDLP